MVTESQLTKSRSKSASRLFKVISFVVVCVAVATVAFVLMILYDNDIAGGAEVDVQQQQSQQSPQSYDKYPLDVQIELLKRDIQVLQERSQARRALYEGSREQQRNAARDILDLDAEIRKLQTQLGELEKKLKAPK